MNTEDIKTGMLVLVDTEDPNVKELARVTGVNRNRVLLRTAWDKGGLTTMLRPVTALTPMPDDPYYVYLTANADIKALRGHGWWIDVGMGYKLGVFDGTYKGRVEQATMNDRTLLAGPHYDLWWLWQRAKVLGVPIVAPEPQPWWPGPDDDTPAPDHTPAPEPPEHLRIYSGDPLPSWTETGIRDMLMDLLSKHVKSLQGARCAGCDRDGFHITDPATGKVFLVNILQDH